jgi:hypothetical protein
VCAVRRHADGVLAALLDLAAILGNVEFDRTSTVWDALHQDDSRCCST